MSFQEQAITAVKDAATKLRYIAGHIGIVRSVDATEAAKWVREVACAMDISCDTYHFAPRDQSKAVMDAEVTRHFEATTWRTWALNVMKQHKLCSEDMTLETLNFDISTSAINAALNRTARREPILSNDGDKLIRDVAISVISESVRQLGAKYIRAFEYLQNRAREAVDWQLWALCLMDQYEVCDKSALTEPFDVDEAQEALATCFKDYEVRIKQLQARIKELESTAGPAFTEDKE